MGNKLSLLLSLQAKSFLNLNVVIHTRDPKRKRHALLMGVVGFMLILTLFAYVGAYTYALCTFGMGELVLPWLFLMDAMVLLLVGLFRTGGTIFERTSYSILGSLPLKDSHIATSRFLSAYGEALLVSLALFLPGMGVYAFLMPVSRGLLLRFCLCALVAPLLPLNATVFLSVLLKLTAGKMQNRTLWEILLSLLFMCLVLIGSFRLGKGSENLSTEALVTLVAQAGDAMAQLYPPCLWLGLFVAEGSLGALLKCMLLTAVLTALTLLFAIRYFRPISMALGHTARKGGKATALQTRSLRSALLWREWKRYLASSVYVINTAVGPLLSVGACVALLFTDITGVLPPALPLCAAAPFMLCAVLCMMPPASVSISMEGKQRWITQTLPLSVADYLDGKLLMTLTLQLPCALLCSILLCFSLSPAFEDGLFLFFLPPLLCVFSSSLALCADIHLGSTQWEQEVAVVKQSAASMAGGFAGFLIGLFGLLSLYTPPAFILPYMALRALYTLALGDFAPPQAQHPCN